MRLLIKFSSAFFFSLSVATMPLVTFAQESAQAANPQKLLIFTSYPAQVIGMDETVTLPVKIHTDVAPTHRVSGRDDFALRLRLCAVPTPGNSCVADVADGRLRI